MEESKEGEVRTPRRSRKRPTDVKENRPHTPRRFVRKGTARGRKGMGPHKGRVHPAALAGRPDTQPVLGSSAGVPGQLAQLLPAENLTSV